MMEGITEITGKLITLSFPGWHLRPYLKSGGHLRPDLKLLILEDTKKVHLNVNYRVDTEEKLRYYSNLYIKVLNVGVGKQLKLRIKGSLDTLDDDVFEYEGVGVIGLLN